MRDEIYKKPHEVVRDFEFNRDVVNVFPDMIQRSVPGYTTMLEGIGLLANHYLENNAVCYDLGCSLGASSMAILRAVGARNLQIKAIDASADMIERAKKNINDVRVRFVAADICSMKFEPCRMVVLNLVLQFIAQEARRALLESVCTALQPEGILVLSEKVPSSKLFEKLHLDFKKANGYSELEISQKRTALEEVMKLDTLEEHQARLAGVGFREVNVWFQCLNWVSIVASK